VIALLDDFGDPKKVEPCVRSPSWMTRLAGLRYPLRDE
jgi:hypothetical protein